MCIVVKSKFYWSSRKPNWADIVNEPAMVASAAFMGTLWMFERVAQMNPLVISSVSGAMVPISGNDVDTDQIVSNSIFKRDYFRSNGRLSIL